MARALDLTAEMGLGPPASESTIARVEQELGVVLPADYREFVRVRNGGEGPVGAHGWARFYPVEDLPEENARYSELDHLADWLLFGTDGGGEAFVFDEDGRVLVVPWIGGREDAIPQGGFAEFLERLGDDSVFDRGRP